MKDDALDRIADALEQKYGVQPYVDVSGVIAGHAKRIANALVIGFGIETKTLSNGTELNELIRIAEALETRLGVKRLVQVGNTTDEPLDRIAHALEVGFNTGRTKYSSLNRIAIALEKHYEFDPILDMFGVVHDGMHRIADVMESEVFFRIEEEGEYIEPYSPPVELYIDFGDTVYDVGDQIDFNDATASVLRENGKISPVGISEITFNPDDTYDLPKMGYQMITAIYTEEAE